MSQHIPPYPTTVSHHIENGKFPKTYSTGGAAVAIAGPLAARVEPRDGGVKFIAQGHTTQNYR